MGLFWELWQHSKISQQDEKSTKIEDRVHYLEEELNKTKALLKKTLSALERHTNKDIDGDGQVG